MFLPNRSEEKRNLLPQLVTVGEAHGPDTCGVPHHLLHGRVSSLVSLPVSETSSKEACEGRDTTEVVVVKTMISGDSVSPHQILHTEIVKGFIKREVGTSALKDMLRGGIWSPAVSNMLPRTGGSPPDVGIGVNDMLVRRRSTIVPTRDTRVVTLVLTSIGLAGVVGHLLALLVSDEGDDGVVPSTTIPYITYPSAQDVSTVCQWILRPMGFGLGT